MWGGFKRRRLAISELFTNWNSSMPLDKLRKQLYSEPRPWFIAYTLHRKLHALKDVNCARLLSWCTNMMQLRSNLAEKRQAYRYGQEVFNMFVSQHRVGAMSYNEYMRLCACGKDLTSAFKWHQYWLESGMSGPSLLIQYTWLLRIAELTPSDDSAEDMALFVKESFTNSFCQTYETNNKLNESKTANTSNNGNSLSYKSPKESSFTSTEYSFPVARTEEESKELNMLYSSFIRLRARVIDEELLHFIDMLPTENKENASFEGKHKDCENINRNSHAHSKESSAVNVNNGNNEHVNKNELLLHAEPVNNSTFQQTELPTLPWPDVFPNHIFPQLEQNAPLKEVTFATPHLRDSLLEESFVKELENASFSHHVERVVQLLQEYEQEIRNEAEVLKLTGTEENAHETSQSSLTNEQEDEEQTTNTVNNKNSKENRDKRTRYSPKHSSNSNNKRNNRYRSKYNNDEERYVKECSASERIWRHPRDWTSFYFRAPVIREGGLTAELYHYLIVALCHTQPSAALRTVERMHKANMRLLDVTRAVMLVALRESPPHQLKLFKEELQAIDDRRKLNEDYQINKVEHAYWAYNYPLYLSYQNALDEKTFYYFVMHELGVLRVQELLLASERHGPMVEMENLVVIDDALRESAARFLRECTGPVGVNDAMNVITQHMPQLDIALIGNVPHFDNYTLANDDDIATDIQSLSARLNKYEHVYILDSSFIETSERFMNIGQDKMEASNDNLHNERNNVEECTRLVKEAQEELEEGGEHDRSKLVENYKDEVHNMVSCTTHDKTLVLVPYITLSQLSSSVMMQSSFVSFDASLQEALETEPKLASQRLRALFAMITNTQNNQTVSGGNKERTRDVRVLHFSESLLSHSLLVSHSLLQQQQVNECAHPSQIMRPEVNDNDHFVLVVAMIRNLVRRTSSVTICTDDVALQNALQTHFTYLCPLPINILCTPAPEEVNMQTNTINDNPVITFAEEDARLQQCSMHHTTKRDADNSDIKPANEASDINIDSKNKLHYLMEENPSNENHATELEEELTEASSKLVSTPWLALLMENDEHVEQATENKMKLPNKLSTTMTNDTEQTLERASEQKTVIIGDKEIASMEVLMNMYETQHDVIPVGVKIRAASLTSSSSSSSSTKPSIFTLFDVSDPDQNATGVITDDDYNAQLSLQQQEEEQQRLTKSNSSSGIENNGTAYNGGNAQNWKEKTNASKYNKQHTAHSEWQGQANRKRFFRRPNELEREMRANSGWSLRYSGKVARSLSSSVGKRVPFNLRYRLLEANVNDPRYSKLKSIYEQGLTKKRATYLERMQEIDK